MWYSHHLKTFPQLVVIHAVKGFGLINKAELDVSLELSCFFNDPVDVGSLISGSSAFSKFSLNVWKFMVHVLLKPELENFEYYFVSVWDRIKPHTRQRCSDVCTRTQKPDRDWDRTVFGCLLRRYELAVDCCLGRGSGCSRPGYGISPLRGGHH